jgi:hypothetical protein
MNIKVNLDDDDDKILLLSSSLLRSFDHFKYALLYGNENTITLEEVQLVTKTKELTKLNDLKVENSVEVLSVSRGRGECKTNLAK